MTKNKIVLIPVFIMLVIILVIGATMAFWSWESDNVVEFNIITLNSSGIGLTFDGGGATTVTGLAPAACTHSTYANMIPLTIDRYNGTSYPAETTLTLKLASFTWKYAKPSVTDLSNIKFAVTTSNNSCTNSIASGDLSSGIMNNSANTAQSQTTKIFDWYYVIPENSGTEANPIHEDYYLYIWIDNDYAFENIGSNQLQDPLQDLSFTVTWTASSIEQVESLKPTLYDIIRDSADLSKTINFNALSSSSNGNGVYLFAPTSGDTYPVYYYRGAVTNNNVYFANKCWKIIRTTGTGGVKLIYNGNNTGSSENPACNNTGNFTQLSSTSYYNSLSNSLAYVGYMYGLAYESSSVTGNGYMYAPDVTYVNGVYTLTGKTISGTTYNVAKKNTVSGSNLNYYHYTCGSSTVTSCSTVKYVYDVSSSTVYYISLMDGKKVEDALSEMFNNNNVTSSVIKAVIDDWFEDNMVSYSYKLEDTPYCNDRSIYKLAGWNPNGGSCTSVLYFGVNERTFYTPYTPSVECDKNDAFTVSGVNGNGALTYPVGLITQDEIRMAGGKAGSNNTSYYLKTGSRYWSMTPYISGNNNSQIHYVDPNGSLVNDSGANSYGVRPVISLRPGTRTSGGNGTTSTPYIIN